MKIFSFAFSMQTIKYIYIYAKIYKSLAGRHTVCVQWPEGKRFVHIFPFNVLLLLLRIYCLPYFRCKFLNNDIHN